MAVLKPGIILQVDQLEPPNDIVAKVLKIANWFMNEESQAKSRHYAIVFEKVNHEWFILEALEQGTVRRSLSNYDTIPHSFWKIAGATDKQMAVAAIVSATFEGRRYDFGFYFDCAVRIIWAWIKHLFQLHGFNHTVDASEIGDDSDDKEEVCTEVADSCDYVMFCDNGHTFIKTPDKKCPFCETDKTHFMEDWDRGAAPTPMAFHKAIVKGWVVPVYPLKQRPKKLKMVTKI